MIDKNIIAQRKAIYGDNFAQISKEWSERLGLELSGKTVALMMADMKQARIDSIVAVLDVENAKNYPDREFLMKLYEGLNDSQIDQANYRWIANNWDEYIKL